MEMVCDFENRTITIGSAVFRTYRQFDSHVEFSDYVLNANKLRIYFQKSPGQSYAAARNKAFCKVFNRSAASFYKHFNAVMRKMWLAPVYHIILKSFPFQRSPGQLAEAVHKAWRAKEKAEQAIKDGLENLLPAIVATNRDPKELKEYFKGSGAWKIITRNSNYRNRLLFGDWHDHFKKTEISFILEEHPTSLIEFSVSKFAQGFHISKEHFTFLKRNCKGRLKDKRFLRETYFLFSDTHRLAEATGEEFKATWDLQEMQKRHDAYTVLLHNRRTQRLKEKELEIEKNFEWLGNVKTATNSCGEFTSELIKTPGRLQEEGVKMHHCVASYASAVAAKMYIVYSIKKNGEPYSTLGVRLSSEGSVTLDQHLKACNKAVDEENAKLLATQIVRRLRKEFKDARE